MEFAIVAVIVLVVVVFIVNSPKKVAEVSSRVPSKLPLQVPPQVQKKENPKVETPFVLTEEFSEILDLLINTNDSIFITGKAGTGKSTLLKHFIKKTNKKLVVLAPTGIAALNVGGQTIHSFFRFQPNFITSKSIKPDYVRAELFKSLQMVIIDEVSMVRSDVMNGIDLALRKNRNRLDEPFGGVQMVFIGDMFQLPPVVSDSDQNLIRALFGGQYFFDASVFKSFKYNFKELSTIFRQTNEQASFKSLLNNIRNNEVSFDDMVLLNSRHKENAGEKENSIFLTTRKNIARSINLENLGKLTSNKFVYTGTLSGKYLSMKEEGEEKLEDKLPAPYKLELKKGAQIMMLKNDSAKRWVNGSIGKVDKLDANTITVQLDGKSYTVEKESWNEVEYFLNPETELIEERVIAGFSQFPIQLAYAMTIHKSQGKTFDKITVDIGAGAFAHGQVYVALSRCKTIEGIVLNNAIKNSDIIVDPRVIEFYKTKAVPNSKEIQQIEQKDSTVTITTKLVRAIARKKSVKIQYQNFDGDVSERQLSDIKMTEEFNDYGYSLQHIKAYCHLRNEERSFKISRIKSIEILD
jgi:ATP-dependent exoDNAse (exonuclease V) alpha subunit